MVQWSAPRICTRGVDSQTGVNVTIVSLSNKLNSFYLVLVVSRGDSSIINIIERTYVFDILCGYPVMPRYNEVTQQSIIDV